jgi:hypothetical protein
MVVTAAKGLFNEHFTSPASETWNALKNGAQRSITSADISGNLWNSLVCSAPLLTGKKTAYRINQFAHKHWVCKLPLASLIFTTISFIIGSSVSFLAIRVLSAYSWPLSSFTADKALRLAALDIIVLEASAPISDFFLGAPISSLFSESMQVGVVAAVSGYFGERSLYVIGALSALKGAINVRYQWLEKFNRKQEEKAFQRGY